MSPRSPTLQGHVPGRQSTLTSHRCREARKCRWVVVDCCPSTMMSTGCDSLIRDPRNSSLRVVYPMRPRRLRRVWLVARAFFFFLRGIFPPRSRVATERVESSLRLCGRSRRFGQYQYPQTCGRPTHRPAGMREPLSAPCVRQLGWVGRLGSIPDDTPDLGWLDSVPAAQLDCLSSPQITHNLVSSAWPPSMAAVALCIPVGSGQSEPCQTQTAGRGFRRVSPSGRHLAPGRDSIGRFA